LARWLAARTPLAPNAGLEAKELEPDILATMRIAASFSRRAMQRFAGYRAYSGYHRFWKGTNTSGRQKSGKILAEPMLRTKWISRHRIGRRSRVHCHFCPGIQHE